MDTQSIIPLLVKWKINVNLPSLLHYVIPFYDKNMSTWQKTGNKTDIQAVVMKISHSRVFQKPIYAYDHTIILIIELDMKIYFRNM